MVMALKRRERHGPTGYCGCCQISSSSSSSTTTTTTSSTTTTTTSSTTTTTTSSSTTTTGLPSSSSASTTGIISSSSVSSSSAQPPVDPNCSCTSAPGTPGDFCGDVFYNDCRNFITDTDCPTLNCLSVWDGSQWVLVTDCYGDPVNPYPECPPEPPPP